MFWKDSNLSLEVASEMGEIYNFNSRSRHLLYMHRELEADWQTILSAAIWLPVSYHLSLLPLAHILFLHISLCSTTSLVLALEILWTLSTGSWNAYTGETRSQGPREWFSWSSELFWVGHPTPAYGHILWFPGGLEFQLLSVQPIALPAASWIAARRFSERMILVFLALLNQCA